jgi:hypothetical protein
MAPGLETQRQPDGASPMTYDDSNDVIVTRGLRKTYGPVTSLRGPFDPEFDRPVSRASSKAPVLAPKKEQS